MACGEGGPAPPPTRPRPLGPAHSLPLNVAAAQFAYLLLALAACRRSFSRFNERLRM